MQDFFNQPLNIGDEVAFMEPHYRNMTLGKIISFAPKSMLIEWVKEYRAAKDGSKPFIKTFRAWPDQVIKKPQ